jgi:tRNA(Ile)-lysidine synthase
VVEQGTHKPLAGGSNPPSATTSTFGRLAAAVDDGMRELEVPDDAAVVLAVSGGADSVALLHGAAHVVASGRRAWRLTVAHLDHQLRPESAVDADAVRTMAAELHLPLEIGRTDVAALGAAEGRSIEEAGREARYRFLAGVAGEDAWIATAHTFDDSVETVLLNLLRGAGLGGVGGIPGRRSRIVRPLLGGRRTELRAWLDEAGIAYRDDPSNADPAYLRNRLRAELLPILESLRPGAVEAIGRFASLAADDDALLDEVAAIERSRRTGADGSIGWRDAPERAIGRRVLRQAIGEQAPSAERIEAVLAAAEGGRGGAVIELGGGRRATIRDRRIRIGE